MRHRIIFNYRAAQTWDSFIIKNIALLWKSIMHSSKATRRKRVKFQGSMSTSNESDFSSGQQSQEHNDRGIHYNKDDVSSVSSSSCASSNTDTQEHHHAVKGQMDADSYTNLVIDEHYLALQHPRDSPLRKSVDKHHVHFQLRDPRPPSGERKPTPSTKSVVVRKLKPASEWDKPKPKM